MEREPVQTTLATTKFALSCLLLVFTFLSTHLYATLQANKMEVIG